MFKRPHTPNIIQCTGTGELPILAAQAYKKNWFFYGRQKGPAI